MKIEPEKKWQGTALGRERRKLLDGRINAIKWNRNDRDEWDTHAVAKARKVVADHDERIQKKRAAVSRQIDRACDDARVFLLFTDDPNEALAKVKALEALARKSGWIK